MSTNVSNGRRSRWFQIWFCCLVINLVAVLHGQYNQYNQQWIADCSQGPVHYQLRQQRDLACINLPCHGCPCTLYSLVEPVVPAIPGTNSSTNEKTNPQLMDKQIILVMRITFSSQFIFKEKFIKVV